LGEGCYSLDDDVNNNTEGVCAVEGGVHDTDDEEHGPEEELEQVEDKVFGGGQVVTREGDDFDEGEEEGDHGDGEDDCV